jgi:hypothetical protein
VVFDFAVREIKCAEQVQPQQLINTHMVLCVNRIPPEPKNRFPEMLCVFSNTARSNARQIALRKIPLTPANQIMLKQLSPECQSSSGK